MATPEAAARCSACGAEISVPRPVARSATCSGCGGWLRTCRNCAFYRRGAYNDCREPRAERVVDKEQANFCDFFELGALRDAADAGGRSTRSELDALFRKS